MAGTKAYEQQAEEFLAEIEEEYYLNGAGLKDTLDLDPIYQRYGHLFTLDQAKQLLSQAGTRAARYLAQFAASQYLDRSVCSLTAQLATAETQATMEWDGQHLPYRMAQSLIPYEPDAQRRRDMIRLVGLIRERLNPMRAERFAEQKRHTQLLGFGGCAQFCEAVLDLRLSELSPQMDRLLALTASVWHERLAEQLQATGAPTDGAHIVDVRHALTAPQFERLFPKERLMPALKATLSGMGIDLASRTNLRLDTEERELKSGRPFCSPVRVPSDIRLVTRPRGGREDYNHLLHEAGHAVHYSFAEAAAPFAFRCLGDVSISEAYAFLFNLLLKNADWLREVAGVAPDRAYTDFVCFYSLYQIRRVSARLGYELELHAAETPAPELADSYCRRLGDALSVTMTRENFLADVDDGFYCARYLRAWMLEVQLRNRLVERYGTRWFASPKAGAFLTSLWSLGQTFTADELAERLGYQGLEVEPLVADLLSAA